MKLYSSADLYHIIILMTIVIVLVILHNDNYMNNTYIHNYIRMTVQTYNEHYGDNCVAVLN